MDTDTPMDTRTDTNPLLRTRGTQRHRPGRRLLRMLSVVAVIGMLLVMLAACGDDDATDDGDTSTPTTGANTGNGGTSTPTTDAGTEVPATPTEDSDPATPDNGTPDTGDISHPVSPNDVIIRIEDVGGFVPQEYLLTRLPHFVLYGDGCFIIQGAQIEIYPQPLLPPLFEVCLTEEGIQQVLQKAQEAGLLDGDAEHDFPGIADASTTVFTTNAGDVSTIVSAYALGIDPEQNPELTPEENAAREALGTFMSDMLSISSWMPAEMIAEAEHPYEADGMRLIWVDAENAQQNDEGLERQELDWPLDTDLATLGEPYWLDGYSCAVVSGDDLDTLMPLLESANQLTLWNSNDVAYALFARPQLPDENGCQEPALQ